MYLWGTPRGIVVKVLNCSLQRSKFELQTRCSRVRKQNMEWFLKRFFSLISPIFFLKKGGKSKFSWLDLLFKHFFVKIQPNMSEQEKKRQRIYDLFNAETKPQKFAK